MLFLLLGPVAGSGCGDEPTATIKMVPVRSSLAIAGKDLYREYCAVCHGTAGKGDGPAASALKIPPTDLTQITKANGGRFPQSRVQHIINGEAGSTAAHGSKDMPIWGNIFGHMGPNPDMGAVRVYNLVKYIQEIQAQ